MISVLSPSHHKTTFDCGKELLNQYLHFQANQDMKRKLSICYVFCAKNELTVRAYYTLSNHSIPISQFPEHIQKKLPKSYTSIPTTLLGRLAVDQTAQGQGLGKIMLLDALKRTFELSKVIGTFAIAVDPIDEAAASFYHRYGFTLLPDSEKMILPIGTLRTLFGEVTP